ncbi:MAG: peptide chain release factor N(5)-glutamine methyltransferase [Acetobacteraceae bacterium]|nr:peptide chain release factor N(5)-glutamine methyltransferase [Acetobacteraceae bacterium]
MHSRSVALRWGAETLATAGIEQARREARQLLAYALGITPEALVRDPEAELALGEYQGLVHRRAGREPLAHIVGRRGFWTLDLAVSPSALIPRPESETLIEAALQAFPDRTQVRTVLDLGTGTGCLLLAALTEFGGAFGIGVDLASETAALAAANARQCGLHGRCAFIAADWAESIEGGFDLVLSNPPYIPSGEIAGLAPEVALHDPLAALNGGTDGLTAYRRLLPNLPSLLNPGGVAIFELGLGQFKLIAGMAQQAGLEVSVRPDLHGIPRALVLQTASL